MVIFNSYVKLPEGKSQGFFFRGSEPPTNLVDSGDLQPVLGWSIRCSTHCDTSDTSHSTNRSQMIYGFFCGVNSPRFLRIPRSLSGGLALSFLSEVPFGTMLGDAIRMHAPLRRLWSAGAQKAPSPTTATAGKSVVPQWVEKKKYVTPSKQFIDILLYIYNNNNNNNK